LNNDGSFSVGILIDLVLKVYFRSSPGCLKVHAAETIYSKNMYDLGIQER